MATTEHQPRRMRFVDLPLRVKVLSAVVVTLAVAVGVGVLGLVKLNVTAGHVQDMYVEQVKPLGVLANARRLAMQGIVDTLSHATSLDAAGMAKVEADMQTHEAALAARLAEYRLKAADPATVDGFSADWKAAVDIRNEVLLPFSRRSPTSLRPWPAATSPSRPLLTPGMRSAGWPRTWTTPSGRCARR